jgi:hypothetical protein
MESISSGLTSISKFTSIVGLVIGSLIAIVILYKIYALYEQSKEFTTLPAKIISKVCNTKNKHCVYHVEFMFNGKMTKQNLKLSKEYKGTESIKVDVNSVGHAIEHVNYMKEYGFLSLLLVFVIGIPLINYYLVRNSTIYANLYGAETVMDVL